MIFLDLRQFIVDNLANYTVEFSAALTIYLISIVVTSWITSRRKRIQFYRNLNPVMKTLSTVRNQTKIDGRYIQAIVQSISDSFEDNFLRPKWYDIIPLISKKDTVEPSECWVCDSPTIKISNKCVDCQLDCKAWDKTTLPRQMEIEKKILQIK